MSAEATFWAWQQDVKSTHKLVLLSLANCHNEASGQCNPSIKYIVGVTGLNRKTVISAMEQLELSGLILRVKLNGSSNNFRLSIGHATSTENGPGPKTDQYQKRTRPKNGPVPKTVQTSPKNGTGPVPKTDHESKRNLKEPKNINTSDQKKSKRTSAEQLDYSSWPAPPSPQVLADWITTRKAKRTPLTQSAVNLIAPELHKAACHGYSVDYCLQQGWVGFKFDWLINREQPGTYSPGQSPPANQRTRDTSVGDMLHDVGW
ncbi:helix-turn-helix domain-containing protein [Microbulbifer sp. 2205BS26-8]|uniref:helix-turn-helix domain-containing protein n=1 Tax=Microbulbifer sp. 2205BS26-8 TaxID=3064386 RepID=UPI00273D11B0|nr:helix-turn-helix domain-containing protein [Microbulbifer sp. 2205BS26-8]MDP5208864.1 helix-turn-helix domain-containing protein [Microbulbifer sp. 2205BS26-8]